VEAEARSAVDGGLNPQGMKYRFADDTPGKQTLIHPKANGEVVKVRGSLPRAATSVRGAASTTVLGLSQDSVRVEGVTMTRNAASPLWTGGSERRAHWSTERWRQRPSRNAVVGLRRWETGGGPQ
jgi:hypothetical protein